MSPPRLPSLTKARCPWLITSGFMGSWGQVWPVQMWAPLQMASLH